jgi:hypothetical protein
MKMKMKKLIALILCALMVLSAFSLAACGDDKEGETSGEATSDTASGSSEPAENGTDTEPPVTYEPNMYPYEGDVIPASVDWDWGAPDANSVYFVIDEANVIHDGKGTWNNTVDTVAPKAFDQDVDTFYDCDENLEYENTEEMNVGIAGDGTFETSYVGAKIDGGVVLTQIRWFPRKDYLARTVGGKFQASTDGETWVDLATIDEQPVGGDFVFVDINDSTVYNYVRYVGPTEGFGNIAEIEIWGTKPAA